ncbi:MAG: HAMP domain-containing histidine kinase, partial [Myxococcales bacterium]|nr:HAMP domain-containing histidine kinase [Myxococcales bacterium]
VQDPAMVRRHLEIAVAHARRVTATLRNLRSVGRTTLRHAESSSLTSAVNDALDLVGPRSDRVMVRIEPADLTVSAEHPLLVRVLSSLARLALETSGRTAIHLRGTRLRGRVLVRIGVIGRDTGKGLSPEIDLSLDRALLQTIGAELLAFPTPHGVSFDLWLAVPSQSRSRPRKRTRTLWVVGSQPVCDAVTQLLCNDDYVLRTTTDPAELLAEGAAGGDGLVAELLSDDGRASGLALARWYRQAREAAGAEVPCVLVVDRTPATTWPEMAVVTLPLSRSALLDALRGRWDTGDPQG